MPYRKPLSRREPAAFREIDPARSSPYGLQQVAQPGHPGGLWRSAALVEAVTKLGDTYLRRCGPAAVAEFIGRGWLEPNIERLKQLYRPLGSHDRRDTAILEGVEPSAPDGGFFVS
jgi:hypothetical protein